MKRILVEPMYVVKFSTIVVISRVRSHDGFWNHVPPILVES